MCFDNYFRNKNRCHWYGNLDTNVLQFFFLMLIMEKYFNFGIKPIFVKINTKTKTKTKINPISTYKVKIIFSQFITKFHIHMSSPIETIPLEIPSSTG